MPNNVLTLLAVSSNTMLKIMLVVLIVLVVLLTALALVFIIALRKRAPVVKVIMAPPAPEKPRPSKNLDDGETQADGDVGGEAIDEDAETDEQDEPDEDETADKDEDDEADRFVTEGEERVRYSRSMTAKLVQLKNETKQWYSDIKNELLSYDKVRSRMSWKRESFRLGRSTFARLIVRGRTLCLLLAVDPSGLAGTKYAVEDVKHISSLSDTPCLYRIKSERRAKYAKQLIAAAMSELKVNKSPDYHAQDFFMPYSGDMELMERGLIKRIVSVTTRTFDAKSGVEVPDKPDAEQPEKSENEQTEQAQQPDKSE